MWKLQCLLMRLSRKRSTTNAACSSWNPPVPVSDGLNKVVAHCSIIKSPSSIEAPGPYRGHHDTTQISRCTCAWPPSAPWPNKEVGSTARVASTEAPPPQSVVGFYVRGVAYPQNRFSHPQSRRVTTSLPRRETAPFRHSRQRDLESEVSAHRTSSGPTLSMHLPLVGFQSYSWEAGWSVR